MVMMYTIPSIILTNMLCSVGRLVPARARMVHDVENRVYSKNWVTLDILVNLVIAAVSAVVLVCTAAEKPNVPVRVWLSGYLVQCLIHVVLVWSEYRRLARRREVDLEAAGDGNVHDDDGNAVVVFFWTRASFAYRYDTLNMMASFVWGNVGLYWIQSGGKLLLQNAPRLYRLTVVYQTYDVIFVMFFVAGVVVCCSLSCIFGLRPVARQQEGASEADLSVLPKYTFHMSSNAEKPSDGTRVMVLVPMDTNRGDLATERDLLPEDAECCICFGSYEDGIELHVLPCNHHFHSTCIEKWLKINAICPVCNYNILTGSV
ncbi:E3 ubiquitin protein ligase RIE1-like isoform X2 [Silene latifolia]|uniref:E3 ubiquitin protein ligase RIE1-like isoform X2 n=1 Tax=Silene latifolia TaxID=37657 RepID=UPI003D76E520